MELLSEYELSRLTPDERLAMISQLWDSLDGSELPLSPAQTAELDRRLDALDTDRPQGTTWEALRSKLALRRA